MTAVTVPLIAEWNELYGEADARAILAFSLGQFPDQISFANSFGLEDVVVQHLLQSLPEKRWESFVLDTGRLPAETYDLIDRWRTRYEVPMRILTPRAELLEPFVAQNGVNAFYQSIDLRKGCCYVRKLEPLARALEGKKAWITGLRREQSQARARLEVFERDDAGRLKVNPLASWSLEQVWAYIHANKLPYNVLHGKGYPSVGCAPCTRAIEAGEHVRAGRWWWELDAQRECGLHANAETRKEGVPSAG